jgi:hypothetical protein
MSLLQIVGFTLHTLKYDRLYALSPALDNYRPNPLSIIDFVGSGTRMVVVVIVRRADDRRENVPRSCSSLLQKFYHSGKMYSETHRNFELLRSEALPADS